MHSDSAARDRGRRRAGVRLHQRLSRHRQRRRRARSPRGRMAPRTAIALASILNFVGAFISLKVAATVATGIIDAGQVTETIAFAGLIGAIIWNLITWSYGLPSSSSHALIGGVIGAMLAAVGTSGVNGVGLVTKVVIPAVIAPMARVRGRRGRHRGHLPAAGPPPSRAGQPRVSPRPDRLQLAAGPGPRDQRRAEDDGRDHAGPGRPRLAQRHNPQRPRLGGDLLRRRRSPWAPTPAAGGSSAPSAAGSSRWTPPRASPPRAPAPS